jgi:DNA-directed RNA polymerase
MILHISNIENLVNNNIIKIIINIENYLADSVQLKNQAIYIFNGQIHTEQEISQKVEEISYIKELPSPIFKSKLKTIFMKSNRITKYKKDLISLYEEKIDKNNIQHMNMLFNIWLRFYPNDRNIQAIDKKWSN